MNIKLIIEYDGYDYHGWQKQNSLPTIQKELEDSIAILLNSEIKKNNIYLASCLTNINLFASGRTDQGVSARGQVANFIWPDEVTFNKDSFLKSINGISGKDISVLDAEIVDESFHARKSARSKIYSYRLSFRIAPHAIDKNKILHLPYINAELRKIDDLLKIFIGTHDFSSYRSSDCAAKTSIRTILNTEITSNTDESINIFIEGTGFLKHMIRMIIGDVIRLLRGQITEAEIEGFLKGEKRNKPPLTLSPYPLTLERVIY